MTGDGVERYIDYGFATITRNGDTLIVYDMHTKVCYYLIERMYGIGISPYYIIVNEKPEIAIYGTNYNP